MDVTKIDNALASCKEVGIKNILALRGDPPVGQDKWVASEAELACGADLVRYILSKHSDEFCVTVAGYPEGHPAAMIEIPKSEINTLTPTELARCCVTTKEVDGNTEDVVYVCKDEAFKSEMVYLKEKVDAGANMIITQMFFDAEVFGTFVTACREYGIMVPIIPGIMCISNYGGFKRMIGFCKTRVTEEVMTHMESIKANADEVKAYGKSLGIKMCQRLTELGAPGLHFYTLNTSPVTISILEGLGYQPVSENTTPEHVFTATSASATTTTNA